MSAHVPSTESVDTRTAGIDRADTATQVRLLVEAQRGAVDAAAGAADAIARAVDAIVAPGGACSWPEPGPAAA